MIEAGLGLLRAQYPPGVDIESLSERSGKEAHQPKKLLERLFGLTDRSDSTELREEIAENTDVMQLENACPKGFKPFAAELRTAFGVNPNDSR